MFKKVLLTLCFCVIASTACASIYYAGHNNPAGYNLLDSTTDLSVSTYGNSTANVILTSHSLEVANVFVSTSWAATGTLSLNTNSTLTCYGDMTVGKVGQGTVKVYSGSKISSNNCYVQTDDSMSWGRVYVDGTGSIWENAGDWIMGASNNEYSSLDITNNGTVEVGGDFSTGGSNTYVKVTTGGKLIVGGTLNLADAVVTVEDGTISACSVLAESYSVQSGATTEIKLGSVQPGIHVTGDLNLAGTLKITFEDNFTPQANATYDILDWNSYTGQFDQIILPELSDKSFSWDTSNLYNDGTISVLSSAASVPEPLSLVLLAISMVVMRIRHIIR